ncbi:uncharacterized protein LOC107048746 [Diachasma alloeum]|uniref:uncharacterized protein LOC107048746 n=1 Tax=Diachasma alloeum TaxID=454923 RepID=UPI0010FB7CD9|nr:uncharacterized protein LOC107048746 [Diachasma alloeum]
MLIARLKGQLARERDSISSSTDQSQANQLKRLDIKPFDGKPEEWKEFSDLFLSLVGNVTSIPPVQKLVRLKGCLRGPAAALLSTFQAKDENYDKAWQKLTRKYEDPRLVAQSLFNRILTLPKITQATEENLSANGAAALETLDQLQDVTGLTTDNIAEQLIAHLLRRSLDAETLKQWELKLGDSKDFPSLKEFVAFIEACGRGINAGAKLLSSKELNAATKKSAPIKKRSTYTAATQQQEIKEPERQLPRNCCAYCQDKHFIASCQKFIELTPAKRNDVVINKGLCFNCLGPHTKAKCTSEKKCHKCSRYHHTLIHGGSSWTMSPPPARRTQAEPVQTAGTSRQQEDHGNIFFIVSVTLQPNSGTHQLQLNAHILKKLTTIIPSFSCSSARIGSLQNLQLADPHYLRPGPIDIILGADNYGRIIMDDVVKSEQSRVVGQRTVFGWILSGPIECTNCSIKVSLSAVRESSNEQLLELLQKFWVQEELPNERSSTSELSPDEYECEMHFRATHSRDNTGRYIVRLPLKTSAAALGESKFKAARQLKSIVSRLNTDQAYSQLYREFINEYAALGHMRIAPETPEPVPAYYLPHHGNDTMVILTWMRRHRLVFDTDIVKMFRQIRVHQDDWDLQRILWIDENQQPVTYQLTTVTYGLNCSPWLSLSVLQQLAEDEGYRFPAAVETLTRGRYVDDIYGGAETEDGLKEIATQLQGLCHAGGFSLQKWSSNCPEALHELGLSTDEEIIQFEESVTKVLGLCWHQSTDTFRYKSKDFNPATITKRVVSSEIAQIFDPLGFIAPVVVQGKILLQDLWRLKLKWDDPLPDEYVQRWKTFRENLNDLDRVTVPRWLRISTETLNIQIHGFADASTVAMSAVVYIRTKTINDSTSTVLVCAKTKVAPLKRMTIPRLELTAALLLTQLVASTKKMLQLDQVDTYLWSDSSVALAWIRSHASRWKDFVHNRVVKIQETLPNATWRHVSGKENPADCASRGISPSQLEDHQLWWSGPEWINQDPEEWPQSSIDAPAMDIPEVAREAKPAPAHPVAIKINEIAELLNRYQTMAKLLAVTATITQHQYFGPAIRVLQRNHQLPRNHQLAKLTPTLDNERIMRLGGRLKNSQLNPDEIHPIILPRQSRLTTLVIEEAHRKTLHGGTQLTLAYTRQRYWIIGGRGTVRAYIQRCAICTRHRGRQAQQQMGQLPATRISPARAFLHTGVDYAGPFAILKWRPTNAQPGDNATTFVGAAEVLEKIYHRTSRENQQVQAALATNGTQWSFSPPRAPHFGGKWEAAVKSTKYHLRRVLGTTTLTFEELNSVVIQIEACLNSRPICPMSDDPDDLQVLTPGHFLIGEPLQLIPEPSIIDKNPSKLQRWNLVTQLTQQFWSRWAKECLQRYQAIYKWTHREENIKVGDMVLMIDENYPPAQWPIGRVIATRPGADGLTRVATIRTAKAEVPRQADGSPIIENIRTIYTELDRPITKLCLLPSDPPPPEQPPDDDAEDQQD